MGRPLKSLWDDGLNERERIVVQMLAAGNTCRATAIKAGITERAVYNIRQKKVVQDAIYAAQAEMFDSPGAQGMSLLPEVIRTLQGIVRDPEARSSDRIQASRVLIASANEYQARRMLERKIRDLERRLFATTHIDPEVGDSTAGGGAQTEDELFNAADEIIDVETDPSNISAMSTEEIQRQASALIRSIREESKSV